MQDQDNSGSMDLYAYGSREIRTVDIEGKRWASVADICAVLEIANVGNAVARLEEADIRTADVRSGGQRRAIKVISEDGATDLVLDSRKPEARKFRRFLTHEVWPAVRDHGGYLTPEKVEEVLLNPDTIIRLATDLKAEREARELAEATNAELAPAANSWNKLADAAGDFSVAEAAKILSRDPAITTGRDRLFAYMESVGWIFKSRNPRGGWETYQTQVDTGRVCERPAKPFLNSKTGNYELPAPTLRITAKGIQRLHVLLGGGPEGPNFMTAVAS